MKESHWRNSLVLLVVFLIYLPAGKKKENMIVTFHFLEAEQCHYLFISSPLARTSHSITPSFQARKKKKFPNLYLLPCTSCVKREAWVFDDWLQPPPWNASYIWYKFVCIHAHKHLSHKVRHIFCQPHITMLKCNVFCFISNI